MGYLPYSDVVDPAVRRWRTASGAATTFGYGRRCLHAAGQFHKGGPATGVFLQLVDEAGEDLEIPGRPYTFGRLIAAHADGDLDALRAHGRPVARMRLPANDRSAAIDALASALR